MVPLLLRIDELSESVKLLKCIAIQIEVKPWGLHTAMINKPAGIQAQPARKNRKLPVKPGRKRK